MLVHKYNSWAPVSHWPHSSWIGCLYLSTPHPLVIDHKDLYSLGWGFMAIIGHEKSVFPSEGLQQVINGRVYVTVQA